MTARVTLVPSGDESRRLFGEFVQKAIAEKAAATGPDMLRRIAPHFTNFADTGLLAQRGLFAGAAELCPSLAHELMGIPSGATLNLELELAGIQDRGC